MEEGGSGDVPPADPPRARPSTASRLVSGLAEQGGAAQGNGAGQGAGRQDGEQLQCRYKLMLGFSLSCLEHRFLYCGHCC